MNKFYFIILGLFSLFIFSCSLSSRGHFAYSEKAFNKIVGNTNRQLEKKYQMSAIGIGGGETKEGIWLIDVMFTRNQGPISKEEGRKMIIDCVETFITAINNDEQIRPFLRNYPFTEDNFEIAIINYQKDGSALKDPDIQVFSFFLNKIFYYTEDLEDKYKYKSKTNEPYSEALEIVKRGQLEY